MNCIGSNLKIDRIFFTKANLFSFSLKNKYILSYYLLSKLIKKRKYIETNL